MKDMIGNIADKIKNSSFFETITSWTKGFSLTNIKDKLDSYIDSNQDIIKPTAVQSVCIKIANVMSSLIGKVESSKFGKIIDVIVRIICTILSVAFIGLTLYVMVKLFMTILVLTVIISAVALGTEIITAVLNKAFGKRA